ncbi:hypothetical protein CRG98_035685 [Punica granatum]|uniref:Uncharacterized protein n=1 Tax=Punica granatum TaxID=22663 RepID=A0A2I0IIL9_PUNGR|nr:hypothetical protein CRG98_035685 [Punica granatum]
MDSSGNGTEMSFHRSILESEKDLRAHVAFCEASCIAGGATGYSGAISATIEVLGNKNWLTSGSACHKGRSLEKRILLANFGFDAHHNADGRWWSSGKKMGGHGVSQTVALRHALQ